MAPDPTSAFSLAVVTFVGPALHLSSASPAARSLLGLDTAQGGGLDEATAADVLLSWAKGQLDADSSQSRSDVRAQLDDLVRRSRDLPWGEGVDVDYVARAGPSREVRKATVLVTSSTTSSSSSSAASCSTSSISSDDARSTSDESTTAYSILFLRPATSTAPPSSLPRSPALAGAILSPPASDPPSRSPSKSPHDDSSDVDIAETVPSSPARSYSSSSAHSDASTCGKRRVVTGNDRAGLPFSSEVKAALARTLGDALGKKPSPGAPDLSSRMSSLDLRSSPQTPSSSTPRCRTCDRPAAEPVAAEDETPAPVRPSLRRADSSSTGSRNKVHSPSYEHAEPVLEHMAHAVAHHDSTMPLSHDKLVALVANMPEIAYYADPNGHIQWMSTRWFKYTGQQISDEPSPDEWAAFFHPDDLGHAFEVYNKGIQSGADFTAEHRIRGADGSTKWFRTAGSACRDVNGKVIAFACNITDVDELVKTRHDALIVKERTKAVLAGSELTLLTIDMDLRISFFEGKHPPFNFNTDPPTLVGQRFHDLCADEDLREGVRKILDEEEELAEVKTATDNGHGGIRHMRYRIVPLIGDPSIPVSHPDAQAVVGCIAVGVDVSDRVDAENALEDSRTQAAELRGSELAAREANRLKTEFLTTVSHEIRTPIAAVLGICELLLSDSDRLADDQRSLIEKAVRSTEVLLDLVGAVLDFRKLETGELELEREPLALSDVLGDASLFGVLAEKKGLDFIEENSLAYKGALLGDRMRLRQVLSNMLSNSLKFTCEGNITLRLRQLSEDVEKVVVQFEISDTGLGIKEDVLPTLFTPFKQASVGTAREYGGSGLGLTITKNLVELMDGTIDLTSTFGEGSRMVITIPFGKAPTHDSASAASGSTTASSSDTRKQARSSTDDKDESAPSRRPQDVRVLLAEDNQLISEIVSRQLRKMGFAVDAVFNGQEAVDHVKKDDYSIVLMDGQMPGVDGYKATRMIRSSSVERIRSLPIVALTASAIAGDRERCLDAGMSTYLAKPVRAKELEATIWAQLDKVDKSAEAA
ncbi:hypothetical protein JCM3775_003145 [Rhodotorula graminis]